MIAALIVSNVVLWLLACGLALVVFALVRQIGVLHERIAPAGALMLNRGPKVGEAAPPFVVEDLAGRVHRVGAARDDARATLLFFLSPTCPVCKSLLSVVRALAQEEDALLLLASDGPRREHEAFLAEHALQDLPYLLSAELGIGYQVARLPYAVLIDPAGVIRAQGLVNSREHLESLFEASERGVASIQQYAAQIARTRGAA